MQHADQQRHLQAVITAVTPATIPPAAAALGFSNTESYLYTASSSAYVRTCCRVLYSASWQAAVAASAHAAASHLCCFTHS